MGTGPHATWNNEADAFKHAFMQAYLYLRFDKNVSKSLGNFHEWETPNAPEGERNMDLWNNAIGREVAYEINDKYGDDIKYYGMDWAQDLVAKKIMEKMSSGEMITSPKDKRKFSNMELERLTDKEKVFYKNEVNSFDTKLRDLYQSSFFSQAIENYWKIPTKEELDKKVQSGSLIYVDNYTRSDGVKVNGYYRRKPVR